MNSLHYIGFDVHKKAISFCVKTAAGEIVEEGSVLCGCSSSSRVLRTHWMGCPIPGRPEKIVGKTENLIANCAVPMFHVEHIVMTVGDIRVCHDR